MNCRRRTPVIKGTLARFCSVQGFMASIGMETRDRSSRIYEWPLAQTPAGGGVKRHFNE
jgi:hypothetical protein